MNLPKRSRWVLPLLLGALPVLAICWNSSAHSAAGGAGAGGRDPLLAGTYAVQQLEPQPDGSTVQVVWRTGGILPGHPAVLRRYAIGSGAPVPFYDDGTHGDAAAADGRYTARFREDIPRFLDRVRTAEIRLATGNLLHTDATAGRFLAAVEPFDLDGFNRGQAVPVSVLLVAPSGCGADGAL